MKYDLHTHTNQSDGELTPEELIFRASEAGINMLAITDHDRITFDDELAIKAKNYGIKLIPSVEISTIWNGIGLHLVGLNVLPNAKLIQLGLVSNREARHARNLLIAEKLSAEGIPDALVGAKKYAIGEIVGRTHFAQYLIETAKAKDIKRAFSQYLANGKKAFSEAKWVSLSTAITWIKDAGGLAVLAHPLRYGLKRKRLCQLLQEFKNQGGDGMEVINCNLKPDEKENLSRLCQQFNLKASCGSDFHGSHMPWYQIGRFDELPKKCQAIGDILYG